MFFLTVGGNNPSAADPAADRRVAEQTAGHLLNIDRKLIHAVDRLPEQLKHST